MSQRKVSVPSLTGGISQQDAALRQPSTVKDMVNMIPDAVWGAARRTPSKFFADLAEYREDSEWRMLDRGSTDQYAIEFRSDGVRAWNMFNGVEAPVYQQGATDSYLLGDPIENLIPEADVAGYSATASGKWQEGAFGSPVSPVRDGDATTGFTRTPDGIKATDGATCIRSTMGAASSGSSILVNTYGSDGAGGVFAVGDDDYLRVSVWVRKGDDGVPSFTLGVYFDSHLSDAVFCQLLYSSTLNEWTIATQNKSGTGTNAAAVSAADADDIMPVYTDPDDITYSDDGWVYLQSTISLKWLRDNTSITSSSKWHVNLQAVPSGASSASSTWDINYWGLHAETSSQLNDLAESYFETPRIRTLNVGNAVYVLNPNRKVQRGTTQSSTDTYERFLLWSRAPSPSQVYTVTYGINGGTTSYSVVTPDPGQATYTPQSGATSEAGAGTLTAYEIGQTVASAADGSSPVDDKANGALVVDADTAAIIDGLASGLAAAASINATYEGSVAEIRITASASADVFDFVEATTSAGINDLVAVFRSVETDGDLPAYAPDGFRTRIEGDPETDVDESYAIFVAEGDDVAAGEIASGYWVEDVAPGIDIEIDATTMPHTLVRKTDDKDGTVTGTPFLVYFEYGAQTWTSRLVGDDTTNPYPTFVSDTDDDRRIQSMFFVDNRIGFTSRNNVAMSGSGDLTNFWRTSVTKIDPAERLDVIANHKDATDIHDTAVSQGQVILLTKKVQFIMEGVPTFTRDTIAIRPLTEFEADEFAEAQVTQFTVAVPFTRDRYMGLNELRQTQADSPFDVQDTTKVVPQYFVGRVLDIASSSVTSMISLLNNNTSGNQRYGTQVAVQSYYWQDRKKLQQAWHKWQLGDTPSIIRHFYTEDFMYLLVRRGDRVNVERITLDVSGENVTASYSIHLDGQMEASDTPSSPGPREVGYDYNTTTPFKTTLTFPTDIDVSALTAYYTRGAGGGTYGFEWAQAELLASNWTWDADARTLTSNASVDYTSGLDGLMFGYEYTSKVELHPVYLFERSQTAGIRAMLTNQLDLQRLVMKMRGVYSFTVNADFGDWGVQSQTITGDLHASGWPLLEDTTVDLSVFGPADECSIAIQTSGVQPMGVTSIEFIGREGAR